MTYKSCKNHDFHGQFSSDLASSTSRRSPKTSRKQKGGARKSPKKSMSPLQKGQGKKIKSKRTSPIHIAGGEIVSCPDDLEGYLNDLEEKHEEDWGQFQAIETSRIETKKEDKIQQQSANAEAEQLEDLEKLENRITDSRMKWEEHKQKITAYAADLCKIQDDILNIESDIDVIRGLDPEVVSLEDLKQKRNLEKKLRSLQDKQSAISTKASTPFDPKLKPGGGGGCTIM